MDPELALTTSVQQTHLISLRVLLMAKLPLRLLGLALLTVTITVASCQAVFHGMRLPTENPPVERL